MQNNVYIYIAVMAIVTYLIRTLPLTLVRREIKNVYLAPQMESIPFTQENGVVRYTVEKLLNHQMVVLDY